MWATLAARAEKGGYSGSPRLTRQDGKSRMDLLDNQAIHWQGRGDAQRGDVMGGHVQRGGARGGELHRGGPGIPVLPPPGNPEHGAPWRSGHLAPA